MPWKDPQKRRDYRRDQYQQKKEQGVVRDWGTISAICPVCSKIREISKNSYGITQLPKDDNGHIIKRCISCSKRKDYAPWFDAIYVRDYQWQKRQELKKQSVEYLGGKCKDCGLAYDGTNAYAFDFHHRDPEQKAFLPASKNYSWEKAKSELDKCDLLCAICHRRRHAELETTQHSALFRSTAM